MHSISVIIMDGHLNSLRVLDIGVEAVVCNQYRCYMLLQLKAGRLRPDPNSINNDRSGHGRKFVRISVVIAIFCIRAFTNIYFHTGKFEPDTQRGTFGKLTNVGSPQVRCLINDETELWPGNGVLTQMSRTCPAKSLYYLCLYYFHNLPSSCSYNVCTYSCFNGGHFYGLLCAGHLRPNMHLHPN